MNVKDSISATMDSIEGNESGDQSAKKYILIQTNYGKYLKVHSSRIQRLLIRGNHGMY